MKSYRQHVRSDATKWFVTTIAILLIGVILTGIMTEGFTDFNPYCWFGHEYGEDGICIKCGTEKPAEDPGKEDPLNPGDSEALSNLQMSSGIANGVRLYAAAPVVQANNVITQTLTAHIEPADADNQRVTWSVAWQNPASEYATGKTVTDYVTVTPESDGSLTATVSCLQDFGEKVVVTVTSEDNAEIQATAICDYLQRVESLEFTTNKIDLFGTGYTYEFVSSDYTIPGEFTLTVGKTMVLNEDFAAAVGTKFDSLNCGYKYQTDWWYGITPDAYITADNESKTISFTSSSKDFASCFTSPDDEYSSSEIATIKANINNAFRSVVSTFVGVHATFDVSYSMVYDGKSYDSGTVTVECNFNYETLKVDVLNITLSESHIIF